MKLFFAFLCCGVGYPSMYFERPYKRPPPGRLIPDHPGNWPRWFHWYKNYAVEHVDFDPQYWCKFLSFICIIMFSLGVLAAIFWSA